MMDWILNCKQNKPFLAYAACGWDTVSQQQKWNKGNGHSPSGWDLKSPRRQMSWCIIGEGVPRGVSEGWILILNESHHWEAGVSDWRKEQKGAEHQHSPLLSGCRHMISLSMCLLPCLRLRHWAKIVSSFFKFFKYWVLCHNNENKVTNRPSIDTKLRKCSPPPLLSPDVL